METLSGDGATMKLLPAQRAGRDVRAMNRVLLTTRTTGRSNQATGNMSNPPSARNAQAPKAPPIIGPTTGTHA